MNTRWRIITVVLVLGNLGYLAWSQGAFSVFGLQPARFSESEPHRVQQQVRPELLQIRKAP